MDETEQIHQAQPKSAKDSSKSKSVNKNSKSKSPERLKEKEKSPLSDKRDGKSARGKSREKSQEKTEKSGDAKSASRKPASPKRKSKSLSKRISSKSPAKRKSASEKDFKSDSSIAISMHNELPKSTDILEDLSKQGISTVNAAIFQRVTLQKLILSGNNLRSLPAAISDLVMLQYLDISKNPLRVKDAEDLNCLPIDMRLMKNLKCINMSECNLRAIPMTIWLCTSLNILDLSRNKIGILVPEVANLQNLIHLNLSQCNLSTLPPEIGFCGDLEEILLMSNHIESLPESLKECKQLKYLRVSYKNFTTLLDSYMENLIRKGQIKSEHIPQVVFDLENLYSLNLKSTKINNFPESTLTNLYELQLDNNYFNTITELAFKPMGESLRILTLSNNLLKEIPEETNSLVNLEVLDLSCNQIEKFSSRLDLPNLKELNLAKNVISSLGVSIVSLKSLEKLNLENNLLLDLMDCLYELVNLKYLDLSYNRLSVISPRICQLKNIKLAHSYEKLNKIGLWIIGNPLEIPCKEIWQTTMINKIYDYLANYAQRMSEYTCYAKLVFIGLTGIGKSYLINNLFDIKFEVHSTHQAVHSLYREEIKDKYDFHTKVARCVYKRTSNKVEWLVLDFGGYDIYKSLYSTFFSSIKHAEEPSVFVVVYNHTEYTPEKHAKHLGVWIESILTHSKVSTTEKIRIKLIGLVTNQNEITSSEENDSKINLVLKNSHETLINIKEKLVNEKQRLESLKMSDTESQSFQTNAKNLLEYLINRNVYIYEEISLIDTAYKREGIEVLVGNLEALTIRLNKVVPLELKGILKNHIAKLRVNTIEVEDFMASLEVNPEIQALIQKYPKINLTIKDILNYSKTMGEIFWLRNNPNLKKVLYLRYNYILNCLKLFIRHDLIKSSFQYNDDSVFKKLRIYANEDEFNKAAEPFKKYGILDYNLVKAICFDEIQLNRIQIEDALDFLRDVLVLYKSTSNYIEEKCTFFQVILPSMCTTSFANDKKEKLVIGSWDSELYTDNYELFFMRLDQLRKYKEEIKGINSLKKQRALWSSADGMENEMFYNYYEMNESNKTENEDVSLTNFSESASSFFGARISPIKPFLDEIKELEFKDESVFLSKYKRKYIIEINTIFKFDFYFFNKLASLVQDAVLDRFDWNDTIIARDLEDNFFKFIFEKFDKVCSKILIEIKYSNTEQLASLKKKFFALIENLFLLYPGLYYYIGLRDN